MTLRSLSLLCLLPVAPAAAQMAEISMNFGQSLFRNERLGTSIPGASQFFKVKDGFRIGARLTFNSYRFMGHEIVYAYSRSKLGLTDSSEQVGMPTHQYGYNLLIYVTPEGAPVRPFVTGGGHFSSFYPPGTSVYSGTGVTKFGANYGAGLKVKVSPLFLVRIDIRDYVTTKPFDLYDKKGALHQIEASAGLGVHF